MDKKPEKVKLFTRGKIIISILAVCIGVGIYAFKYYSQKGYVDSTLVISVIFSLVIGMAIIAIMAWWANKP